MARHPDWFLRLDTIVEVLRSAESESLGRKEMSALFGCSERDSIRLLHKFGAEEIDDALSLPRPALLAHLEAIRGTSNYAAFLRRRQQLAKKLSTARTEGAARQFRITPVSPHPKGLKDLPKTITWRRGNPDEPGRFEILYDDGSNLMLQIAEFLAAVTVGREEFFAATEPRNESAR